MGQFPLTLNRFIVQNQASHQGATEEFSSLLTQIGLVGKLIAQDLRRAGLINILGTTGDTNVQGETVKKLDAIANDTFVKIFQHSGFVCALASEEMEKPISLPGNWPHGRYMLLFDPLDGSSNTDLLSHEQIKIQEKGKVYAVNEGNYYKWPAGTQKYVDSLKARDKATGRPYSGRYSGCLVADVHRILLGGGIYLYPGEVDKPEGKLRLLYEANPLALVVERAGGKATTGTSRILEVEPKKLHQRVPLIIGSRRDVEQAEAFIQGRA
ncbi:MAG: fructose-1,6-bisphosphatase [Nitrospirae bacterium]|nr:fructose-1,6-bisphosphatase [Nitrospirota bacterium]